MAAHQTPISIPLRLYRSRASAATEGGLVPTGILPVGSRGARLKRTKFARASSARRNRKDFCCHVRLPAQPAAQLHAPRLVLLRGRHTAECGVARICIRSAEAWVIERVESVEA